jgi:hypothetical protein
MSFEVAIDSSKSMKEKILSPNQKIVIAKPMNEKALRNL